jgi:hypothetical protein
VKLFLLNLVFICFVSPAFAETVTKDQAEPYKEAVLTVLAGDYNTNCTKDYIKSYFLPVITNAKSVEIDKAGAKLVFLDSEDKESKTVDVRLSNDFKTMNGMAVTWFKKQTEKVNSGDFLKPVIETKEVTKQVFVYSCELSY